MRKLFICVLFVFIMACSTKSEVVIKDTDYLKYGTRASVIEKVWGKPDETMAFQDYRAKGYYSFSGVGGSWGRNGGSVSGLGFGGTYIPTTIVWTYKEKGYALFFQQQDILGIPRHALSTLVWKLVGWENLKSEKTILDDDKIKAQIRYAERKINEAGLTSDSDNKLFWALMEKAPKDIAFEEQVEWAIKRTKEIMSNSEKK
jgi:hypothetical protein